MSQMRLLNNPPSPHVVVIRLLLCLLVFLLFNFLSYILEWFMFETKVNKSIGIVARPKAKVHKSMLWQ